MSDPDVAKQAIELAKQGVSALYSTFQQIAPEVWKMTYKQTQINGIECLIGAGLCLLGVASFLHLWKQGWDDESPLPIILTCAFLVAFIVCLLNGLDLTFNPGYWTLVKLGNIARGTNPW